MWTRQYLSLVAIALAGLAAGCETAGTSPADATAADVYETRDVSGADTGAPLAIELHGPCEPAERIGGFLVEAQSEFSFVDGKVADSVVPVTVLREVTREGGCVLLERRNPFCDPPCEPGSTCDYSGRCVPFPAAMGVGTVSLTGLQVPVELEPVGPAKQYFDTAVPHPVFEPGAPIRLRASGDDYGPFALGGYGVELMGALDGTWRVERGASIPIRWDPAESAGGEEPRSRVLLRLNIDQHGNSPITLQCDLPDTGTAEIPASVVDALLDAGVSGFPNGALVRRTVDSVAVEDGCLELVVSAPARARVRVGGHTPCSSDDECPAGETCDVSLNTCR